MNNYRRKILERAENGLEAIHAEIEVLSADEQTGEAGGKALLKNRVDGWQRRINDLQAEVERVKDEEEETAENTRGEDRKAEMEEAVSQMQEFYDDCDELTGVEVAEFAEFWHSRYDSMIDNLQSASA